MRFLLVDRVDDVVPGASIRGWKNVAMSEDYLEWHFPGRPVVPGTLVLEAFSQLAGWLEAASSGFAGWVLVDRVVSARYFGFSGPGDRIDLALEATPSSDPARRAYRGEARVDGERRALVELEGRVVPLEELADRGEAERAFRTLRGDADGRGRPRGAR